MKKYQLVESVVEQAPSIELQFLAWITAAQEFESDPSVFPYLKLYWLRRDDFKMHVRWTQREVNGKVRRCLDIASIYIPEKYQNQGCFRRIVGSVALTLKKRNRLCSAPFKTGTGHA